jgi:dihydrofolate reductase
MTMGKVTTSLTMSLDGFIAGPNDGPEHPLGEGGMRLFDWYSSGDTEFVMPSGAFTSRVSAASAAMMRESYAAVGALISGRKTFDITDGWGGRHTVNAPVFVVTHEVPQEWIARYPDAPFTFVTDGVESAVAQAKAVAGDKDVAVAAASLVQQCLKAGLLDEFQVDVVPFLLGGGVRLFEHFGQPVELERIAVIEGDGVTHLRFRVVR